MTCPKCGSYVNENSKFCSQCGAVIEETEKPNENNYYSQDTSENYQNGYTYGNGNYQNANPSSYDNGYGNSGAYGFNQPSGELTAHLNSTFSIVVLIINIVFFNLIGVILSVLSLSNYNNYENELRNRNFSAAEVFKTKSKRYAKIALILEIIFVILSAIAIVAIAVFGFLRVLESEPDIIPFDEIFSEEFMAVISNFFMIIK